MSGGMLLKNCVGNSRDSEVSMTAVELTYWRLFIGADPVYRRIVSERETENPAQSHTIALRQLNEEQ